MGLLFHSCVCQARREDQTDQRPITRDVVPDFIHPRWGDGGTVRGRERTTRERDSPSHRGTGGPQTNVTHSPPEHNLNAECGPSETVWGFAE